ncbi:MAG: protein kinase, partial [Candidatus Krumholzibacteriota bacterium]|nr:protein kinase [Candidatus Krumholzibacteriota bacterium]
MIGRTIGHYQITEKIGEGGMGVVYKAVDTRLDRHVAIKVLARDISADESARRRLLREAKAASSIEHSNIVTIHDVGETDDGQLYIVMALHEGMTLDKRIAEGPVPVDEAARIVRGIAMGLVALHKRGVIHRDIKPGNIILSDDGHARLVDFGLAKLLGASRITTTGTTVGTMEYMAPEQVSGDPTDARADVFSLGVVLYELLTGQLPFRGEHKSVIVYSIVNRNPIPIRELNPSVPEAVAAVVDRALEKSPADRFQSAGEFRDELGRSVSNIDSAPLPTPAPVSGRKPRTRRRLIPVLVSIVLALLAGGAALVFHDGFRDVFHGGGGDEPVLAVVDFRDLSDPDDLTFSAGISGLIHVGLVETGGCRVVSPERLYDVRRRRFGSGRGNISAEEALQVARESGATLLLTGQRVGDGPNQIVTCQLIETKTGNTLHAQRVDGSTLAILADGVIGTMAPVLSGMCGGGMGDLVPVQKLTSELPEAYRHYVLGIVAQEKNETEDALAHLRRAVELDSGFALAWFQLAKAKYSATSSAGLDRDLAREYIDAAWRHRANLSTKDRLHVRAWKARLQPDTEESARQYRAILARWPDDRGARLELTALFQFFWELGESGRLAREGLDMYPDDPEFTLALAVACQGVGKFDD